ncbi:MAG: helix-turn-helix transcriptional regulator [Anaerolineae bacterium]|nr:helix-turn-helix transcriptional regulator [Anaerolineae bacterium]
MDEQELTILLEQWEGVYKKGLLTFWVLLLLHERPMYVFEMGEALETASRGTITADERSLYRALRRFERAGFVESEWQESDVGPRRRYYRLCKFGDELLRQFTKRNILLFQEPDIAERLARLTHQGKGK